MRLSLELSPQLCLQGCCLVCQACVTDISPTVTEWVKKVVGSADPNTRCPKCYQIVSGSTDPCWVKNYLRRARRFMTSNPDYAESNSEGFLKPTEQELVALVTRFGIG